MQDFHLGLERRVIRRWMQSHTSEGVWGYLKRSVRVFVVSSGTPIAAINYRLPTLALGTMI